MTNFQPAARVFDVVRNQWATYVGTHTPTVSSIVYDAPEGETADQVVLVATRCLEPAVLCCPVGDQPCGRCVQLYPDDIDTSGYKPERGVNPDGLVRTTGLAARYAAIGDAPPKWDQLLNYG